MSAKLRPNDPRAPSHTAVVRGRTYRYMVAAPPAGRAVRGTILLIHGFPDLGFGWRYQVPLLAEQLGLRVVVPDMLGYGGTDAPDAVAPYAYKSVCADLVALVDHVGVVGDDGADSDTHNRFFVGGHDWGGAVAWRMVLWHAPRLRGVFSVCTPYFAPARHAFVPLADMARRLPNFGYQQQFASDTLCEFAQHDVTRLRQFLLALYGGRIAADSPDGPGKTTSTPAFDTVHGVHLDRVARVGPSRYLAADELDFYVAEYARHGLRGPTNWYRTGQLNWADERVLVQGAGPGVGDAPRDQVIDVPALMLSAAKDGALPPALAESMEKHFSHLTKALVPGGHWALWQSSAQVNEHIKHFLEPLLGGGPIKAAM